MTPKKSKRILVVDACVLRSAGETVHPVSSTCRVCLEKIRTICHKVIVTNDLKEEWNKHKSRFSSLWLVSMAARKKYLVNNELPDVDIDFSTFSKKSESAVRKDIHLVEAAYAADKIIVTLDTSFESALKETSEGESIHGSLTWINPVTLGHNAIDSIED